VARSRGDENRMVGLLRFARTRMTARITGSRAMACFPVTSRLFVRFSGAL
jgi:hypothetical protein